MPERVLVTGSSGYVGRLILSRLREDFVLRCLDEVPGDPGDRRDELVTCDVTDTDAVARACREVDSVVHLAARRDEADFLTELLPRNIVGTWSVLEAARQTGVRRVILASSVQTVLGGGGNPFIRPDEPARPMSLYACTKLFGEALGRYYAEQHGLGVACLRLGWVSPAGSPALAGEPTLRRVWCDPTDLGRLIAAAIRSDVPFATVFAVSRPADERFDCDNPFGWEPQERAPREGAAPRS